MTSDTWYFAYGSNLWKDQKEDRTGDIRTGNERPRIATLKDYRLAFNKRGRNGNVANIVPCAGDEVMGVVYRWDDQSRRKMGSRWEIGYEEAFVEVVTEDSANLSAVTFVAKPGCECAEARPADEYLQKIILGGQQHGLPKAYIQEIKRIAKNPRSSKTLSRQLVLNFHLETKA